VSEPRNVLIHVDAAKSEGALPRIWNYIGYDECNYTYTPEGQELLAKFSALGDQPVYVRVHHLFCTGNCHGMYKWGSTNVYLEDEQGKPVYDWTFIDLIFDTLLRHGCKPFVELGFMPLDLVDPTYYTSAGDWSLSEYRRLGWSSPPKDYGKWYELVFASVRHCIERFGEEEVLTWYWEVWNEPNIFYWRGSLEEYERLYDMTAAAVKAAHPAARVGGPSTTNPDWSEGQNAAWFLDQFCAHTSSGTNYYTGQTGSPLDFITFHVKGGGFPADPRHRKRNPPSIQYLYACALTGYDILAKYPGYRDLECILSECDPDGWAAGGRWDNRNLNFRNTEYYASFVACAFDKLLKFAQARRWNLKALTWAFLFVGERCFEGTRTFSTQGIDKAILNLFRMYGRLGGEQLRLESSGARDPLAYPDPNGKGESPDISGLAARAEDGSLTVLLYSHHDDWDLKTETPVEVVIDHLPLPGSAWRVEHYRIDAEHSNAYAEWLRQGSPMYPSGEQRAQIKSRAGLELLEPACLLSSADIPLKLNFPLPVRAVSLLVIRRVEKFAF
jgi:xylan 1,4-beta-xylosidase